MRPPARLPVELYRPIVQQVGPRKVLYRLLFVSRAFWDEAERVLYGKITLQGIRRPFHLQLFETIASCDRISHLVQHLYISLYSRPVKRMYISPQIYWNSLAQAFRAVCNLKKLYLMVPDRGIAPLHLFLGCTFRLRILVIDTDFNPNPVITLDTTFLNSQTELVKLDLCHVFPQPLPSSVFPKLAILIVSDSSTAQFIARPSLRALNLDLVAQTIPPYESISKNIKSLRLGYRFIKENIMRFPALRFLHIDNIQFLPLASSLDTSPASHYIRHGLQEMDQLLANLVHLTGLEKLILRMLHLPAPSTAVKIHEDFFRSFSSLQVLSIERASQYLSKGIRLQWLRDSPGQTMGKRREREWQDEGWD